MTSEMERECEWCEARLLAGEKPGDDPALAAHIGSCLRCFRAAGEMRDLSRLAPLLRDGDDAPDPGHAFWNSFPARVSAAWEASRPQRAPGLWPRLARWFHAPLPAALAGAACAGLMFVVVGIRPRPAPEPRIAPPPPAEAKGPEPSEGARVDPEVDDELLRSLDVAGLEILLDDLHEELGPSSGPDDGDEDADLAAITEELDTLDEAGLKALSRQLDTPKRKI
jgi:hypothetical protein